MLFVYNTKKVHTYIRNYLKKFKFTYLLTTLQTLSKWKNCIQILKHSVTRNLLGFLFLFFKNTLLFVSMYFFIFFKKFTAYLWEFHHRSNVSAFKKRWIITTIILLHDKKLTKWYEMYYYRVFKNCFFFKYKFKKFTNSTLQP